MTHEAQIGIIGCLALVLLLAASMPVAFAMAIVGLVGFAALTSTHAACMMCSVDLLDTFASHGLTVIPLFILMGQVAFHTGISRSLFDAAHRWFGHLPGGLAMATVGACAASAPSAARARQPPQPWPPWLCRK